MDINNPNLVLAALPPLYKVNVNFRASADTWSTKEYSYLSFEPVEEDGLVIVDSPFSGPTIVKVCEVRKYDYDIFAEFQYRFIMQVVDSKAHVDRMQAIEAIRDEIRMQNHKANLAKAKEFLGLKDNEPLSKLVKKLRKKL